MIRCEWLPDTIGSEQPPQQQHGGSMTTFHDALTASTQPRRDDDVAAWIKARRDAYYGIGRKYRDAWQAMDDLLDEWRLLADTGRTIAEALAKDEVAY